MCSGPKSPASPPPPPPSAAKAAPEAAQSPPASSLLLELAASDDLPAFRNAVQNLNLSPSAPAPWYSRSPATRRMSLEPRTPLHIAALYGSTSVLRYLLPLLPASHASLPSGTDLLTPLHLAAAGGAGTAVITILLSAGADPEALDSAGHRPADLIQKNTMSKTPNNKLTYTLDINLPDIKTGVYSTDEFRIYTFKVKPCSRAYSHDWTECPFVHPGENARRRDPRKFLYSSIPCPEFRKSAACRNGDGCEYAHGVFESWLHPAQYRTRLCKDETGCNRRVCFFAHKVEELRTVNQTAGLSMPMPMPSSPRSPSVDMAAAMMLMQQQQQAPMSPSSLHLPSRLKASLAGRDIDFDSMDLRGLEGYLSSPRSSPSSNLSSNLRGLEGYLCSSRSSPSSDMSSNLRVNAMAAASRAADYSELLGAMDRSVISGLSMQQTATVAAQYQSMTQQMNSGYGSSSLGLDHSTAQAIMNSRASAFAKRSQSFIDRGAVGWSMAGAPVANTASGWGSPSGKLDWGIQGDELNKLRKSASFAIRSSNNPSGFPAQVFDEPDVSWVHSLVKDGPAMARPVGQAQHQYHHGDMLSPWAEQEQTVA